MSYRCNGCGSPQKGSHRAGCPLASPRWLVHYTGTDGVRATHEHSARTADEAERYMVGLGHTVHSVQAA